MAWWRRPSTQTRAWNVEDDHAAFITAIKKQIEQGVAPWQQSWRSGARRLPEHLVSGHAYRGVHALQLSVTHTAKGYRDNRWATAAEIQALGGQVRPGEQAAPVLCDTVDDERQAQPPPGAPNTDEPPGGEQDHEQTRPPMVRVHAAFNVEQADGLTLERRDDDRATRSELKTHELAERIIMESGVDVRHVRGDRAFYNLQTDRVTLPERDQFASANGYYQTVLHELGHATGHPDRLDRATLKNGVRDFGSVEYAREELRAELSAMLTGVRVGVGHDGSRGATYVQGWLTALEHDPQEIDKAAAEAQHMSDSLLRQVREHEQAIAQKHAELAATYSAARRPQISPAPTARPLDPRHVAPSSGPFRGHDGGHGGGRAEWYTDRGGGVPKTAWGVSHATRRFFPVVVRGFRPRPDAPNRASGEGEDGSDPPFLTAGAVRQGGRCPTQCPTGCPIPPPPLGGSLPSVGIPAGRLPGPRAGRTMSRDERPHA